MIITRTTKAGKKRYGVRVDRPGRQQEWIGTFDTRREARQAEAEAIRERQLPTMACDAYATHYLIEYQARVKRSSYDTAAQALRKFSADFRGIPLTRVERIAAEKWARENRWRVPAVVALFNSAMRAELVHRNPFAGLSRKGEGRRRKRPLTIAEIDQLAAAAAKHGPTIRGLVLVLAYTGIRIGEAFALEWDDVDLEAKRITVERRVYRGSLDLPKGNRTRLAVVTPRAREALMELPRTGDLLFTGKRGARLSASSFSWYWQSISAVVPRKITPHDSRHFAGWYMHVEMGLQERVVAAFLGHDDGGKLVRLLYGHGDVGALEEIDRAFENVVPIRRASNA